MLNKLNETGQGYAPDKPEVVPADVMELARVKSGYEQSLAQYESACYEVEHATQTAPFDGVVANLFDKAYNLAKTYDRSAGPDASDRSRS